jgi:hypothetical protein
MLLDLSINILYRLIYRPLLVMQFFTYQLPKLPEFHSMYYLRCWVCFLQQNCLLLKRCP